MNSSCEEMLRLCDETSESLSAESAGYFADTWEETSRGWLLLISHTEINEISASIYEMAEHARMGNEDEAIVYIGMVRRKLEGKPVIVKLSARTVGTVLLGIIGALVLGIGMCMTMIWNSMAAGIVVGIVGIVLLICQIPAIKGIK